MKLIYFELKKLTMHRLLVWFLLVCLCGNFILCYTFAERDDTYFYLQKIEEDYEKDPVRVTAYYNELCAQNEEYFLLMQAFYMGELDTEPTYSLPCTYSNDPQVDDYALLCRFFAGQNVAYSFAKTMEQVIAQAKIQQSEILFSYDGDSDRAFGFQQQGLIAQTYENVLKTADLSPGMGYGWDQFFRFDTVNIFLFLLVLVGTLTVFLSDAGNIGLIVRITKKGRERLSLAKIAAFSIFALLSAILLLLTAWLAVLLKCGAFSDISNSIAVFADFRMVPMSVSIGEYLLLYIASKLLLGCAVAAICALCCVLLRNISLGCIAAIGVAVLNFLLYQFLPDSARYFNLFALARFTTLTATFRCFGFFGYAVLLWPVALIGTLLLALCGCLLVLFLHRHRRVLNSASWQPILKLKKLLSKIPHLPKRPTRRPHTLSLFGYELRKLFSSRSVVFLLIIISLLKIGVSVQTYAPKTTYQTTLYAEYMETLTGPNSQEKQAFIEEEYGEIQAILSRYEEMRAAFFAGTVDYTDYDAYLKEYHYATDRAALIEKLHSHAEYLNTLPEKGVTDGYFLYDVDWDRLWEGSADLLLILCIVFLFSGVFSDEYGKDGIVPLIRTSKNGRAPVFKRKMLLSVCGATALSLSFGVLDLCLILTRFQLPCADAPLLSFEFFKDSATTLAVAQFLALSAFLRMIFVLLISLLSTMMGALIKNKLYTLVSALGVIFLPKLATEFGFGAMRYFDLTNTLQPAKLFQLSAQVQLGGDWGYLLVLLSAIFLIVFGLTFMARKEYCK